MGVHGVGLLPKHIILKVEKGMIINTLSPPDSTETGRTHSQMLRQTGATSGKDVRLEGVDSAERGGGAHLIKVVN